MGRGEGGPSGKTGGVGKYALISRREMLQFARHTAPKTLSMKLINHLLVFTEVQQKSGLPNVHLMFVYHSQQCGKAYSSLF